MIDLRVVGLRVVSVCLVLCSVPAGYSQQSAAPATGAGSSIAAVVPVAAPTRISLDVLVTGKDGKPVGELEPSDFSLLDNNEARKILSFRRTDGIVGNRVDPPVEVIIVLDSVNMAYQAVTQLRLQLLRFLRQNGGKLAQPVSVFVYGSDGLHVQPAPSKDGNALAAMMETSVGTVRSRATAAGDYGLAEQFTSSLQTLKGIAENEARKPGRKVLIWLGNGWPLLDSPKFIKSTDGERQYFQSIVDVSKKLREARIAVYGIYTLNSASDQFLYEGYLKPVKDFHKADAGNLSMQVLARQTGGRVLGPSNDIAGAIDDCIGDIGAYYTLVIAAPQAAGANEYHELKVTVDQPGLTGRTSTGYYNQP
jgi:VWFA-related protein